MYNVLRHVQCIKIGIQNLLLVDSLILLSDSSCALSQEVFYDLNGLYDTTFTSSGLTSLMAFFVVGGTIFTRFITVI